MKTKMKKLFQLAAKFYRYMRKLYPTLNKWYDAEDAEYGHITWRDVYNYCRSLVFSGKVRKTLFGFQFVEGA